MMSVVVENFGDHNILPLIVNAALVMCQYMWDNLIKHGSLVEIHCVQWRLFPVEQTVFANRRVAGDGP